MIGQNYSSGCSVYVSGSTVDIGNCSQTTPVGSSCTIGCTNEYYRTAGGTQGKSCQVSSYLIRVQYDGFNMIPDAGPHALPSGKSTAFKVTIKTRALISPTVAIKSDGYQGNVTARLVIYSHDSIKDLPKTALYSSTNTVTFTTTGTYPFGTFNFDPTVQLSASTTYWFQVNPESGRLNIPTWGPAVTKYTETAGTVYSRVAESTTNGSTWFLASYTNNYFVYYIDAAYRDIYDTSFICTGL